MMHGYALFSSEDPAGLKPAGSPPVPFVAWRLGWASGEGAPPGGLPTRSRGGRPRLRSRHGRPYRGARVTPRTLARPSARIGWARINPVYHLGRIASLAEVVRALENAVPLRELDTEVGARQVD
jgi:hypothetical protein